VQLPGVEPTCAGIVAPEIPTELPPATAETLPPTHVVDAFGTASMVTPAGKLSVRVAPVRGVKASLNRKTVKVDRPPCTMEVGVKLLLIAAAARRELAASSPPAAAAKPRAMQRHRTRVHRVLALRLVSGSALMQTFPPWAVGLSREFCMDRLS
jgi:hypothetical protein